MERGYGSKLLAEKTGQVEPKFRDPNTLSPEQLTDPDYRLKQIQKLNVELGRNQLVESTRPYEKPLFQEQTTMNFPEKILEHLNQGRFLQVADSCSRCHHCR